MRFLVICAMTVFNLVVQKLMPLNMFIEDVFKVDGCEVNDIFKFNEKIDFGRSAASLFDDSGLIPWNTDFENAPDHFLICPMDWSAHNVEQENLSNTMEVSEETCRVRIDLTSPTILEAVRDLNIRLKECERRLEALVKERNGSHEGDEGRKGRRQ